MTLVKICGVRDVKQARAYIRRLAACHVQAMVIGEVLVTSPDPGAKVRELLG